MATSTRGDASRRQVLRLAIIGFGMFGQRHAATIRANADCTLVGVADPGAAAAGAARDLGVPIWADAARMLDACEPDGVVVATPNAMHVDSALAGVARGIPVLVEKPIADSVAGAKALCVAARNANVPLLVGHHRRYNPVIEKAREIVRSGIIGRLVAVNAMFLVRKPDAYFDIDWRREPGGGPILINFIHDIDNLRYIAGEITDVQAFTANAAHGFAVEDSAALALRFANGALGSAVLSDATPAPWSWELTSGEAAMYPRYDDNCYGFAGTLGSLTVPRLELYRYDGTPGWTAPLVRERIDVEHADPQARQLAHFLRVIADGEAPRVDGDDATRTLEVTLSIAAAARRGGAHAAPGVPA
jgi:predicted dehydrogenase